MGIIQVIRAPTLSGQAFERKPCHDSVRSKYEFRMLGRDGFDLKSVADELNEKVAVGLEIVRFGDRMQRIRIAPSTWSGPMHRLDY